MTYLLPLMVTFGAARYSGMFFADGIYDIQLHMKNFAYLASDLRSVGLLNLNPVTEVMSAPAITLCEVDTVKNIYNVLKHTKHNGFPTLDRYGRFRGLILRKTLVSLLEVRSFAGPALERTVPLDVDEQGQEEAVQGVEVSSVSAVFYDSLEKKYPKYTKIEDVTLSESDMVCVKETERDRHRERQRQRQREAETHTHTQRERMCIGVAVCRCVYVCVCVSVLCHQ